MNWRVRGEADGQKGMPASQLEDYKKVCRGHGFLVAEEAYLKGREVGLKVLCTYDGGHGFGIEGNQYQNTCPKDLEVEFLKGYRLGHVEYELQEAKRRLNEQESQGAATAFSASGSCNSNTDCGEGQSCVPETQWFGTTMATRNVCR